MYKSHPANSLVAVVDNLGDFKEAAHNTDFRAVLLPAEQTELGIDFPLDTAKQAEPIKFLSLKAGDVVNLAGICKEIKDALHILVCAYSDITGTQTPVLNFANINYTRAHSHDIPVLSCAFLGSGSVWYGEDGSPIINNPGDVIFMKPSFKHNSPTNPGSQDRRVCTLSKSLGN